MHPQPRRSRSRRLLTRTLPLVLVAIVGLALGIYVSQGPSRSEHRIITTYVDAWSRNDYRQMYSLLSDAARKKTSAVEFTAEIQGAEQTATLDVMRPLRKITIHSGVAEVPFVIHTRVFGTLRELALLPLSGSGGSTKINFSTTLLFPGLRPGELLSRRTTLGRRGNLLAANGTALAQGPQLSTPIPEVASAIAGTVGPIPASEATMFADEGYPTNAKVGVDGLEAIFQSQLAGRLGGQLLAGTRLLAEMAPVSGHNVRTTIVPSMEQAAIDALGDSYSGMTVINPRTGGVEAAVGLAFTASQPPGSTFKIITSAAALQDHVAKLDTEFPVESSVDLDGFDLQNAAKEACGGTLLESFAQSCDTVFAPLGAKIGGRRLVSMAERFGFNKSDGIATVVTSTLPSAADIGGPLAVGSSAIGQGKVLATTLEMADVGATIDDAGKRPVPTFLYGAKPRFVPVISAKVASEIQEMMEAVVSEGTGVTAQIPGVVVAGKTGTAELSDTAGKANDKKATDAWFVGYAPAGKPKGAKVVACALFPNNGYGEASAAPAVRSVLEAALGTS